MSAQRKDASLAEQAPPTAPEAEAAVLGSIFIDRRAMPLVAAALPTEDPFFVEAYAMIYRAMLDCHRQRVAPDVPNVAMRLRREGLLEAVGGREALHGLTRMVPSAVNVDVAVREVKDAWLSRRLIATARDIIRLGYDRERDIQERIAQAAELVFQLSQEQDRDESFWSMGDIVNELMDDIHAAEAPNDGIPTGYPSIDRLTGGLHPGEQIIVAARPGIGKTALLLNLAYRIARSGRRIGIYSLEMDRRQLCQRLLAIDLGVDTRTVRALVRQNDQHMLAGMARIFDLPIYVDHQTSLDVLQIRDRARRLVMRAGEVDLWMIDYLQLARGSTPRADEVERIGQISKGLAAMAREFRAPLVTLSQMNRKVEERAEGSPRMSDLRGSGAVEEDASQIWMLARVDSGPEEDERIIQIRVVKNRNGAVGDIPMVFVPSSTTYRDPREGKEGRASEGVA